MADKYLIVGLGNPGRKYEETRHNAFFLVVEELARRHGMGDGGRTERKAIVVDGMIKGKKVILAKPQTFMNLSGESVRALVDFYKVDIDKIIVIYDELDLPFGTLRLRNTGGHGGHNGVRNIIQHLGTRDFARVRFGIGRPPGKMPAKAYVLEPFTGDDKILQKEVIDTAADAIEHWLQDGLDTAMTRFNGDINDKPAPEPDPKDLLQLYERAHELAPNDPEPLEKMLKVYKRISDLDKAVETHLKVAELYDKAGRTAKANNHRERAASIKPELVDMQRQIAETYLRLNNSKKAVGRYLILAEYFESKGELEDAAEAVLQALEINPQHPKALNIQERLDEKIAE